MNDHYFSLASHAKENTIDDDEGLVKLISIFGFSQFLGGRRIQGRRRFTVAAATALALHFFFG